MFYLFFWFWRLIILLFFLVDYLYFFGVGNLDGGLLCLLFECNIEVGVDVGGILGIIKLNCEDKEGVEVEGVCWVGDIVDLFELVLINEVIFRMMMYEC